MATIFKARCGCGWEIDTTTSQAHEVITMAEAHSAASNHRITLTGQIHQTKREYETAQRLKEHEKLVEIFEEKGSQRGRMKGRRV